MAAGWIEGLFADPADCELLVAAGARAVLEDFAAREAVAAEHRTRARSIVAGIDRGARAFASEKAKGQAGPGGASSESVVVLLTRSEVAGVLGVSAGRVSQLVSEGRLAGRKVRGRLEIEDASVDAELARRSA